MKMSGKQIWHRIGGHDFMLCFMIDLAKELSRAFKETIDLFEINKQSIWLTKGNFFNFQIFVNLIWYVTDAALPTDHIISFFNWKSERITLSSVDFVCARDCYTLLVHYYSIIHFIMGVDKNEIWVTIKIKISRGRSCYVPMEKFIPL